VVQLVSYIWFTETEEEKTLIYITVTM